MLNIQQNKKWKLQLRKCRIFIDEMTKFFDALKRYIQIMKAKWK